MVYRLVPANLLFTTPVFYCHFPGKSYHDCKHIFVNLFRVSLRNQNVYLSFNASLYLFEKRRQESSGIFFLASRSWIITAMWNNIIRNNPRTVHIQIIGCGNIRDKIMFTMYSSACAVVRRWVRVFYATAGVRGFWRLRAAAAAYPCPPPL